ncbi:dipeptidyl aminopeptidase/acylaminoacyl peptidase [Prauserella shujinwangii]|uniref:Dipeptidyl aminopeptidase/acylaminoacyl peptidase n=1 Tax=Prauserella shujinwangii TaxID=1453103 RepID=A0A2T0LSU2_9PSEU|nr:S9 family peptidase [Prauserella shujinwangii]PRX46726.1 dipeptidyl aminopeptidase/acylaminoacyl peptidase [Prauserella shujinwangii]
MRPTDIALLATPGRPALRGDLLLVAVSRPDLAADSYRSSLYRVGPDGATPWTHGERDSAPAISPDGRWVAFLRATGKSGPLSRPQLHVMPAAGGESRRITELPLGVEEPAWAPDSRRIAFLARVPEPGRYGLPEGDEAEAPAAEAEAPRRITRFDYRLDDVGFLRDRPKRLFVLDVLADEPGEPEPLTGGATGVSDPVWAPDGESVLVVAPRDWDRTETHHSDLYTVPAAGGDPVLAVRTEGNAAHPVVTGDGTVLYLGAEFTDSPVARNTGLWAAPLGGEPAAPRRLTDTESVDCAVSAGRPVVSGERALVVVRHRGAAELRAVPLTGERLPLAGLDLLAGERAAVRAADADGDTVAVVVAGPADAGEVALLSPEGSRTLTDFSGPLRAEGVRPAEELTASAPDGYPVHGWIVLPEGEGPHPVLLVVHGGPFAPYEWSLFDEAQVYASAGYAVVLPNPRGSASYGEEHGRTVLGRLGTVDADDILALLDAALERADTDESRVGLMGGSYGGFMTGWLAAHHGERFRAAWSERAVNAWDSFTGSSDIGWFFTGVYVGDDPEEQRRRSPLTHAGRIRIPFAVVHSEHDWRCPVEQAQRMFVALKRNGTETELLLFPGEGHELSRTGRPRHRVHRFEAVLDWWARHLSAPGS